MSRDSDGDNMSGRKSASTDEKSNADRKLSHSVANNASYIPVLYDGIPNNIQEKARIELNETEENILKGLTKFKAYIKQEKLPPLDDIYLLACLRVSKYDFNKAQDKLKKFYHMRHKIADSLEKLTWVTARTVIQKKLVGIFPYRDETGRSILFTRGVEWYPEICDFEEYALTIHILMFFLITSPVTTIAGVIYLCDIKARDLHQLYIYSKHFHSKSAYARLMPLRLHVDVVHDNAVCHKFYNFLRPLLPTKLVKRLRMHGYNYKSLHSVIDASILSEEYGGNLGPISNDFFIGKFEEFFHTFKAQNEFFLSKDD